MPDLIRHLPLLSLMPSWASMSGLISGDTNQGEIETIHIFHLRKVELTMKTIFPYCVVNISLYYFSLREK